MQNLFQLVLVSFLFWAPQAHPAYEALTCEGILRGVTQLDTRAKGLAARLDRPELPDRRFRDLVTLLEAVFEHADSEQIVGILASGLGSDSLPLLKRMDFSLIGADLGRRNLATEVARVISHDWKKEAPRNILDYLSKPERWSEAPPVWKTDFVTLMKEVEPDLNHARPNLGQPLFVKIVDQLAIRFLGVGPSERFFILTRVFKDPRSNQFLEKLDCGNSASSFATFLATETHHLIMTAEDRPTSALWLLLKYLRDNPAESFLK